MNILYIVPYVPNLIRVRPYNLIRQLGERGHAVTLVTLWISEKEGESLSQLEGLCSRVIAVRLPAWRSLINCLQALPTDAPLQAAYSWDPGLARQAVESAVSSNGKGGFDVIQVEHLRGVRYGLFLQSWLKGSKAEVPIVWDSVDSISHLFRQAMVQSRSALSRGMTRFELGRTETYEAQMAARFDHTLVTSEIDRRAFLSLGVNGDGQANISVLHNGVDLDYFCVDQGAVREPATLVVSGKMSYHANVAMVTRLVDEIMPAVWSERPDVKVLVVGKDPPQKLTSLGDHPNITVTGTVPDLRPYLHRATIAVAPVAYGAGIQNKVLEAMACGTPVVASPQAVSAIGLTPGEQAVVADNPQDFSSAILGLLEDPEHRHQVGLAGRRFVEQNHHWGAITARLEEIYRDTIDRKRKQTGSNN